MAQESCKRKIGEAAPMVKARAFLHYVMTAEKKSCLRAALCFKNLWCTYVSFNQRTLSRLTTRLSPAIEAQRQSVGVLATGVRVKS